MAVMAFVEGLCFILQARNCLHIFSANSQLITLFVLQVYKRKTEAAKKEYLKALAAYRASQLSQVTSHIALNVNVSQILKLHIYISYHSPL